MLALAMSALLHAVLLASGDLLGLFSPSARPVVAPALVVRLPPLPEAEPLLKNSLRQNGRMRAARNSSVSLGKPRKEAAHDPEPAARQKPAEHRFYPPEAIARGLQGEVRLLLILGPAGEVLEARVASSSGHPLLDRAATEAAYALQSLSADGARELILPVIFKLQ